MAQSELRHVFTPDRPTLPGCEDIMYKSDKKLLILDADGTTIDAFSAIEAAFSRHGLVIGEETRFQKRHNLLKYMGGLKEFPSIIRKNLRKNSRAQLIDTLTGIYRQEARLYDGIADLIRELIAAPDITVGIVTRTSWNVGEGRMATLPVFAYNQYHQGGVGVDRAWAAALTLILIVMLLNLVARPISRLFSAKTGR